MFEELAKASVTSPLANVNAVKDMVGTDVINASQNIMDTRTVSLVTVAQKEV